MNTALRNGSRMRRHSAFSIQHSAFPRPRARRGFTAIEMVVVVGIIAIISAVILIRFPAFSASIHLQRSSRETALLIRRAQNMALSVRKVPGASAPTSFGVHIDRGTSPVTAILFGDVSGNDGKYDPSADVAIDTRVVNGVKTTALLDQSVRITSDGIICDASGTDHCTNTLDVSFRVPEARMSIYGDDLSGEQSGEVIFSAIGSAHTRKVIMRASGQIFIR